MRIGLFRGSFDPPHFGHIFGAIYALKAFSLDHLLVAPVYNHPFGKKLSHQARRYHMVELAFDGISDDVHKCLWLPNEYGNMPEQHSRAQISVVGWDWQNPGGHCIDFLRIVKQRLPEDELIMLGGSDTDAQRGKYHDEEEILKLCTVARMPRSGYSQDPYAIPNYSSSEIRRLIKLGEWEALAKMMPANIIEYIRHTNLYKEESVVSKSESQ